MSAWHVRPEDLGDYRSGTAGPLLADSIETHLLRCAACREALAVEPASGAADASERRWAALLAEVDAGSTSPLLRLGAATGPLLASLGFALALVVALPVLVDLLSAPPRLPAALLMAAPLAPMLAVLLGFRPETDPVRELGLAAPVGGLRLVLRRAVLVSALALPAGVVTALLLGVPIALALAWVVPGLALSSVVLAAGTLPVDPATAAAVTGGGWALAVAAVARWGGVAGLEDLATGAPLQLAATALTVGALLLAYGRRDLVTYRRHL
ncbi:hypothetical protein [Nocardioides sp. GY 10113]|uniref:hypothetical protein n=1 Tax=Nocardioides sp. GY 10113 TaxID=2569761 RepID=UPI00197D9A93|nr:hypothetical protein [Nocardioides sp. GY 10113]